jgi:hypothetical protein
VAKIASVEALRCRNVEARDAFVTLAEGQQRHDPDIADEAVTLYQHLEEFSFLVCLTVRHGVLFQINVVSKYMKTRNFDVSNSVELLEGCHEFPKEYKENG